MSEVSHKKYLTIIMTEKFAYLNTLEDCQTRLEVVTDLFDTIVKNIEFIREHFPPHFKQAASLKLLSFRSDDEILLDKKYDVIIYNE